MQEPAHLGALLMHGFIAPHQVSALQKLPSFREFYSFPIKQLSYFYQNVNVWLEISHDSVDVFL